MKNELLLKIKLQKKIYLENKLLKAFQKQKNIYVIRELTYDLNVLETEIKELQK